MSLWNEKDAVLATKGSCVGSWEAQRVVIDSRAVRKGDLFVAIKGERFDGHDYVAAALENGAVAAMVSKVPDGVAAEKLLVIADCMRGLELLAIAARSRCTGKVIGVTGSVGKTSTKEMLRIALSVHGECFATQGNFNNHIGVPLNLANMPANTDYAILEMGMNHGGEISHLTKMVRPDVAVITNVEAVHIEFFESIDGIADAKSEIFEGVTQGGAAIINRDSPHYGYVFEKAAAQNIATISSFGAHEKADCRLASYEPGTPFSDVAASIDGTLYRYRLGAMGKHWAQTSLLVLLCAYHLRLDIEKTAQALASFCEPEGRGRPRVISVSGKSITLIDDSYNASAAAMRAAFVKTDEIWRAGGSKGRKIAALGDMLELGDHAQALHQQLADDLQVSGFDQVYSAGSLTKYIHDALPKGLRGDHMEKAQDLVAVLEKKLHDGDVLLVKGSHGSHMYEVAAALHAADASEDHKKEVTHAV